MNGMTIHGWAGIGIKDTMDEHDIEALEGKQYLWKRFDKARVLIIDEVSMLHAHRLDMVERVCRRFKRSDKPFGGLQVILSGDFFQLPPINRSNEANLKDMVLHSKAWQIMNPAICYLTEQHRQEDETLTMILKAIFFDFSNRTFEQKLIQILWRFTKFFIHTFSKYLTKFIFRDSRPAITNNLKIIWQLMMFK
jgi:hypothetical protein